MRGAKSIFFMESFWESDTGGNYLGSICFLKKPKFIVNQQMESLTIVLL